MFKKYRVLVVILMGCFASSTFAEEWSFEISPYVFGSNLSGETGVEAVTADVDMSFGDILDNLDSAFMGSFVASNGSLSIMADAIYAKLKNEETDSWQGPGGISSLTGELEATLTQEIYQLAVAYRISSDGMDIDLFGGLRYTQLDTDLDLVVTTGGLLPGGSRNVNGSESWIDPLIGANFLTPLGEKWSFLTYLDYGFGSGDSDGSYQVIAGFNHQTFDSMSIKFGYRYLAWDFQDESNGYVWDMTMEGLYGGVGFRF